MGFVLEVINADDDPSLLLYFVLEPHRTLMDLALEPSRFDSLHYTSYRRDFFEQLLCFPFQSIGQRLDIVRSTERVDHVGHARLVSQDLLCAERESHRRFGGQRERFVQ